MIHRHFLWSICLLILASWCCHRDIVHLPTPNGLGGAGLCSLAQFTPKGFTLACQAHCWSQPFGFDRLQTSTMVLAFPLAMSGWQRVPIWVNNLTGVYFTLHTLGVGKVTPSIEEICHPYHEEEDGHPGISFPRFSTQTVQPCCVFYWPSNEPCNHNYIKEAQHSSPRGGRVAILSTSFTGIPPSQPLVSVLCHSICWRGHAATTTTTTILPAHLWFCQSLFGYQLYCGIRFWGRHE